MDGDNLTDIQGTTATVTLKESLKSVGNSSNPVGTDVSVLNVETADGNASISEATSLDNVLIKLGTGQLRLTASGSIDDSDGNTDIFADTANITSVNGGVSLGTKVSSLDGYGQRQYQYR